jgi:Phage capsid family
VKKIATTLVVSDEMLDDGGSSVQSYLNSRLALFVAAEEEQQLLRGAGTNDLVGLMDSSRGIDTTSVAAGEDNITAIARVISDTRGSSWLEPDAIVMHPSNWLTTRLLKDGTGGTVGAFFGGGPFSYGPYGNALNAAGAGVFGGETLWGKRVVLSTIVGAGTALVGSFSQAARIMRRSGPSVEASNSGYINGTDLFTSDLVALRCESRLALCCFRPSAYRELSGLT